MVTKQQLKMWFSRGKYPLASQFAEWMESYWHKNDKIPMSAIDGLTGELNDKVGTSALAVKQDKEDAGLETGNKSIVGAINELLRRRISAGSVEYIKGLNIETVYEALEFLFDMAHRRSITLNYTANNILAWHAPAAYDIEIESALTDNVESLVIITHAGAKEVDTSQPIYIEAGKGELIQMQIKRINPEINATISVQYALKY